MIAAVESLQEGSRLPHVLDYQPEKNTCLVYKKAFEDIIDNKARLVVKVLMLGQLEYLDRSRKNASVRNGRVTSAWHSLTERYWAKLLNKNPLTVRKALNELEAEGLIERLAAYDELGAPVRRLRNNRGYPNRNRRISLNTAVINQRMAERLSNLRTTSLDSFSRPLCATFSASEEDSMCVQKIPKSLSGERDCPSISGASEVSTPTRQKRQVRCVSGPRKGRQGSRHQVWSLTERPPANNYWFRELQKEPQLVAALLALGYVEITSGEARMWLRHMRLMDNVQREEIFCELATRRSGKRPDMKAMIKWLKRKREDGGKSLGMSAEVSTLASRESTQQAVMRGFETHVAVYPQPMSLAEFAQSEINRALNALATQGPAAKKALAHIRRGYLPVSDIFAETDDAPPILIPFHKPYQN